MQWEAWDGDKKVEKESSSFWKNIESYKSSSSCSFSSVSGFEFLKGILVSLKQLGCNMLF